MKNTPVIVLLWVATAGVGWFVGTQTAAPKASTEITEDGDVAALRAENERLREELRARGPSLEASGAGTTASSGGVADKPREAGSTTASGARRMPEPFSIEGVEDPESAVKLFQQYASEMWAHGKEGHLGLIKALDDLLQDKDALEKMFASEEEAVKHLYPMIKFLINNEQNIAATTETLFETMANEPQKLGEVDKDTLEIFTEGAGMFMPAIMDDERMEKMRGYARKILETPEAEQPESIQRNRRDIARLMRFWQPPLSADEALAKLQAGEVSTEELRGLLSKLGPEHLRQLDLAALLGDLVEQGDYRAMAALGIAPLDARTVDALDRRFLEGARKGTVHQWNVQHYLRSTKRTKWVEARTFVETGLDMGGKVATTFAGAVMQLPDKPGKDWVAWALSRYQLPEATVQTLKRAFGIQ